MPERTVISDVLIDGFMAVVTAIQERGRLSRWGWILFEGVLGIILFVHPGAGLLSILWLVGVYSIVFGISFIVRAVQHRSWTPAI